jgi:hypothetical protein
LFVVEQRKTRRYDLRLPLEVIRTGTSRVSFAGETKNISSGGVLFASEILTPVGEPIEYLISLPGGPTTVRLHCMGKVLRHEADKPSGEVRGRRTTLAVTLERYEFQRPKSARDSRKPT